MFSTLGDSNSRSWHVTLIVSGLKRDRVLLGRGRVIDMIGSLGFQSDYRFRMPGRSRTSGVEGCFAELRLWTLRRW